MSLNSIMQIGMSGLSAYSTASEVTGENVANVNTPGYSRQRVLLETAPQSTSNGFSMGSGVRIASVERYYDGLLQQQLVTAQSTQGNDTTRSTVLQQIEPTFNEVANDGLGAAISDFFNSWQDLTLNPAGTVERQTVLSRAQILAENFHSVSTTLNNNITTQDSSLVPLTADISEKLKNIALLNGQIRTTQLVSGNANELKDQRDLLIRDLSTSVGIVTSEPNPPDGTVNVNLAGGGQALVGGNQYATMYAVNTNTTKPSAPLNDIYLTGVGNPPPASAAGDAPITTTVGGGVNNALGELGARLAMRDTVIPGYLTKVNELANQIATQVNALHTGTAGPPQTGGADLNGNPGINFFDFNPPLGAPPANAASNIFVKVTNTDQIAAATAPTPPATFAAGDNTNALAIAKLTNQQIAFSGGSATFSNYFDSLVSTIGVDVQKAKTTVAQDNAFTSQLTALRESSSGVSLDEELTNLVKYQRSYQASAKLITTATDMMDTVIGLIR